MNSERSGKCGRDPEGREGRGLRALTTRSREFLRGVWQISVVLFPVYIGSLVAERAGLASLRATFLVVMVKVGVSLLAASLFLRFEGTTWRELGLAVPPSWLKTGVLALGAVVSVWIGIVLVKVVLVILLHAPAPDLTWLEALHGNLPLSIMAFSTIWISAALGEEMLVRGFLFDRLRRMFGGGSMALTLAVVVSSVLFGAGHLSQGMTGVACATVTGLVFAVFYLAAGRNLWVTILAHGLIDTLTLIGIYRGGTVGDFGGGAG